MSFKITLSITLILFSNSVLASLSEEIEHLLSFVEKTQCMFKRNENLYSGIEAAKHINQKYLHYRDEIVNIEDFIRLSATKSMMSGKEYQVLCKDSPTIKSHQWLTDEIEQYRQNNYQTNKNMNSFNGFLTVVPLS